MVPASNSGRSSAPSLTSSQAGGLLLFYILFVLMTVPGDSVTRVARNVVRFLNRNKTMDNAQKHNNGIIRIPSQHLSKKQILRMAFGARFAFASASADCTIPSMRGDEPLAPCKAGPVEETRAARTPQQPAACLYFRLAVGQKPSRCDCQSKARPKNTARPLPLIRISLLATPRTSTCLHGDQVSLAATRGVLPPWTDTQEGDASRAKSRLP
jgi:hypothetical protein